MSTFSIRPVSGYPTPTPTENKRNLQFQWNGQDIGRRNTDTVNFGNLEDGLAVTIGVGENVNVLTVGAPPPPEAGGWDPASIEGDVALAEENYLATLTPPGVG